MAATHKRCTKCGAEKAAVDFYRRSSAPDGRRSQCKACADKYLKSGAGKAAVIRYRTSDKFRTGLAARSRSRKARLAAMERARIYRQRNPQKSRARDKAKHAARTGRLLRQPCVRCGTMVRVEGHHEDYSRPLDVTWLCRSCHRTLHKERAAG